MHTARLTIVTGVGDDEQRRTMQAVDDVRTGAALVGVGMAGSVLWYFIQGFFILGNHAEEYYETCLSATEGRLAHINRSTFPTQVWCEVEGDAHAGAVFSFWESLGLSSVFVVLALIMCFGVWMMMRLNKGRATANVVSSEARTTADYSGLTHGEAVAAVVWYSGGLALLILSFSVSYANFLSSNTTSGMAVILLLAGAGVAFISSFFVWITPRGQTARFVLGALSAGGGALSLAVWPFVLPMWFLPDGEELRSACWYSLFDAGVHGGTGKTLHITTMLFPTQISCDVGPGPSAVVFSGLEATALSAVVLLFVFHVLIGVWLMVTRGRTKAGPGLPAVRVQTDTGS